MKRVESIPPLPPRPKEGHKGTFGRVLVVGGNDQMIGAPVLAGTAALRSGAGLVQVAMPRAVLVTALSITPELIGLALGVEGGALAQAAGRADAIVVGPGMGQSAAAVKRVRMLVRVRKPMVVDADALNIVAAGKRWPRDFRALAVLTPHPGEMGRLARLLGGGAVPDDEAGRVEVAARAAREFGQVVVLKGHRTVVTDGERVYVNQSGDSTLAKAGSGDVLSGVLGCLLAQKMERFEAAVLATWLHGKAGEAAGKIWGTRGAMAREVIDALAGVMREYARGL